MKIIMLVNWEINYLQADCGNVQSPNKFVKGEKYWFFRYWPEKDVDVDVIDFSSVPLFHDIEKRFFKFYILQAFRAFFKMKKYDLVISHGAQSGLVLGLMRRLCGINAPPHIIIDIGCFNGGRNREYELAPIRFAARSISGVVYHSAVQEGYYRRYLPFLKTRFIPFGVDTEFFFPENIEKGSYVLSVGYVKRDYVTLLEAWAGLQRGKTTLKIVGIKKGILRGIPDGVELSGMVPVNEFKKMVAGAKFIILPLPFYKYSYGQMTLLQSMAMAKAVIITRTPSTEDYILDGKSALFVEPYNVDDMKNKIEFLLNNPLLIAELETGARNTVMQKFNEKNMAENIYKFVKEILSC